MKAWLFQLVAEDCEKRFVESEGGLQRRAEQLLQILRIGGALDMTQHVRNAAVADPIRIEQRSKRLALDRRRPIIPVEAARWNAFIGFRPRWLRCVEAARWNGLEGRFGGRGIRFGDGGDLGAGAGTRACGGSSLSTEATGTSQSGQEATFASAARAVDTTNDTLVTNADQGVVAETC
jgi:hypothetical protein